MDPKTRWDSVFSEGKDFTTFNDIFIDRLLLPKLDKKPNPVLLDIGCGTGDVLKKMLARGYAAFGVDVSSVAVEAARRRTGLSDTEVVSGDIEQGILMRFRGESFDLIIIKLVIAFVSDKQKMLESAKELLSPTGKVLIITPLVYDNIEYSNPRTKNIAVNEKEFSPLLASVFKHIEMIHQDFLDDNGVLGYYLCS